MAVSKNFPAGLNYNVSSTDADEMREQSLFWTYEHKQYGRGKFEGWIEVVHTHRLQLSLSSRSPGIYALGGIPSGTTMISLPLSRRQALIYRGKPLGDAEFICLKDDEELEVSTLSPTSLLTVAVQTSLFEKMVEKITGTNLMKFRPQDRLRLKADEYQTKSSHLVTLLRSAQAMIRQHNELDYGALDAEILKTIILGALPAGLLEQKPRRSKIARKAEKYIRENLRRSLTISELCQVTGSSERTLFLGFKERYGVSPKSFIQMMRLNAVRRELSLNTPANAVTDTALGWGFDHLGRFSEQYRRMFGELPSETKNSMIAKTIQLNKS